LSPQTHYLIASLFREAGFPPGVLNFLLHRPEDAPAIFDVLINHPAIKKCNFTGSTQVGRIIASQAALALKPVLLELGGKNFTVVLDDADLDLAAREITKGAFLNVSPTIGLGPVWGRRANIGAERSNLHVDRQGPGHDRRSSGSRSQDSGHLA
jgi:hypothetical protein